MSWLSDIFSPIGGAISSVASPILNTVSGAARQIAPLAGTVLGGMYGGPGGAMLGSQLGSMAGNLLGGGGSGGGQQQQPQLGAAGDVPMGQLPSYGGQQAGNYMASQIPQQYQNANFGQAGGMLGGQMGQMAGNYLNNQFGGGQYGNQSLGSLANQFGNWAGNRLSGMMPSWMQGAVGNLGQQFGNWMNQGLGSYANQTPMGMMQQFGQQAGSYLGNRANQMLPEQMQGMNIGQMPGYMGQQAGQMFQDRMMGNMPQEFRDQPFSNLGGAAQNFINNRFGGQRGAPPQTQPQRFELQRAPSGQPLFAKGGYLSNASLNNLDSLDRKSVV